MDFHEDSIGSRCDSRPRQRLDKFRLPSAALALATGQLQSMSYVKDHGISQLFYDSDCAHIHDG